MEIEYDPVTGKPLGLANKTLDPLEIQRLLFDSGLESWLQFSDDQRAQYTGFVEEKRLQIAKIPERSKQKSLMYAFRFYGDLLVKLHNILAGTPE